MPCAAILTLLNCKTKSYKHRNKVTNTVN